MTQPAWLIINADDYGYFDCVSEGILEAARHGRVTATGLFANVPDFDRQITRLDEHPQLDLGVHLNLTDQPPLSPAMRKALHAHGGRFAGKFTMAGAILARRLPVKVVEEEWRTQIERCLNAGLRIRFLNAHEHLHMLPALFRLTRRLACEYGIAHVRLTAPESLPRSAGALIRDGAMALFAGLQGRRAATAAPRFLGMAESGRLSLRYLERTLPRLRPGGIYELMCHPGLCDPAQIPRPDLLDYHDWRQEFVTLMAERTGELLRTHNVRLIGYRHLKVRAGRLEAVPAETSSAPGGPSA